MVVKPKAAFKRKPANSITDIIKNIPLLSMELDQIL